MNPRIEVLKEQKLIGQSIEMSLINNKTAVLWSQFAPRIKEINNRVTTDRISLQRYPIDYYHNFSASKMFKKWAAVVVSKAEDIPKGMATFTIEEGLYAVFDYKGSSADTSIYQYIFFEWIPNSNYLVDNRPHFEVLGKHYKNNDPSSEEEIWIPIKHNP